MKNKRIKSTTVGGKVKKVVNDVSPSTSIPPLVEGHVRCFLRVTLSRVLWTIAKPPPYTLIRLRWWGETTSGTVFCPRDGSLDSEKDVKCTSRFPVQCGSTQFTSYLTDMGSLVLDVLTKPDHLPIARVQIPAIAKLSISHSINGSFTLMSPVSEKLGELQVTLALEPLTERYISSSSVPFVDMSTDTGVSALGLTAGANMLPPSSSEFGFKISGTESDRGCSSRATPIGEDHAYFQERQKPHYVRPKVEFGASVSRSLQEKSDEPAHIPSASVDLLSVLLARGNKLRNAMVVSALQADINSDMGLKDMPLHLSTDNNGACPILPPIPSSVQVMEANLNSDIQNSTQDPELLKPDMYDTAVEQLLGSVNRSVLDLWDGEGSVPGTLSGCSSVLMDSELSDAQYDLSLMENLFYKASMMDGCLDTRDDEHEQQKSFEKNGRTDLGVMPHRGHNNSFYGLSVARVSFLESISVSRVTVIQLAVPTDSVSSIPRKQSGKGRPPLPLTARKCSYFVEYHFPLLSANNDAEKSREVTRAVSNTVVGGVVKFHHRSLFSVRFSGPNIKQWWNTKLNFTVYLRKSHQKKPLPIGTSQFSLRSLLQSDRMSITTSLPVQIFDGDYTNQGIGPLKVSFELATSKKGFTSKSRVKNMAAGTDTVRSLLKADGFVGQLDDEDAIDFPQGSNSVYLRDTSPMAVHPSSNMLMPEARSVSPQKAQNFPHNPAKLTGWEDREILFHTLLMVPDGKDFHCAPLQPNVHLNCKLFGAEETIRSVVSWGQTNPTFSFLHVAPVYLTSKLLDRMRNNVMIIEVWTSASSAHNDKLVGLVKLPVHQFYMSFRDPKICQLLLQAQHPVVAVDSYMPVVDIFSGGTRGSLRVFLAMGTSQQITALQRMREKELSVMTQLSRPVHLLDHRPIENVNATSSAQSEKEHVFLVRIERIKGLTPLQSTIWGEADCYIQYSFPTQEEVLQDINPDIVESQVHLKSYRTATTLCIPDPVFGHCETHVLVAPPSVSVQRLLLSSLASQHFSNGGGIQFEIWCRYYYPNVREQLVARAPLSMAKLCALVTMRTMRQGQIEAQLFCLPLEPTSDKSTVVQTQPSGLLEVSVQYKTRLVRRNRLKGGIMPSRLVNLVVQVHRATGLKAAARAIGLQYYSEVGVNSFVTLQLSFLPEKESRKTRIAARSFCPEFKHHTEFCCQLQVQRYTGESVSLAEVLLEATAIFTVYNRDEHKVINALRSEDIILGSVKIQLADLLYKRTGISGWYGLSLPPNVKLPHSLTSVGGLELAINFSHCIDREDVLSSARILGWEIEGDIGEDWDDKEKWDTFLQHVTFSINIPIAWLPVPCLLLPGHTQLQRSTYCYYRYKLYDQEDFCSELRHPTLENREEGMGLATVTFMGTQDVKFRVSQPLLWYMREEKLEVQLWVSFSKEKRMRPHKSERLVGSAFVDLSAVSKSSTPKQTISGVYPLFKPSATDLGGAALRAHISVTTGSISHTPLAQALIEEEVLDNSGEEEEDKGALSIQSSTPVSQSREGCVADRQQTKSVQRSAAITIENTFTATVIVERALHLRLKACPPVEQNNSVPSCWVSYVTADEPATVSTAAVQESECPVWYHKQECSLSKELLLDPQQSLVFKVWHKGEIERVIGFASVDLSPLLSGFQSMCGWYNIIDLSGQCQGQIKLSVSPLMAVQELRGQRQTMYENCPAESGLLFSAMPLCYQTRAVYSSFPSHISRFSEQRIRTPEQVDRLLFTRSSQADPHDEHVGNVCQFHKNLQEKKSAMLSNFAGDTHPSSSSLFSALRKNLSELDDIQKYFSRKLSTPVFSVVGEVTQNSVGTELHRDLKIDTQKLLLKSSQLGGEVNEIIENINENQMRKSSSNTHKSPSILDEPEVCVFSSVRRLRRAKKGNCGTENDYIKAAEAMIKDVLPLGFLTSEAPDASYEEHQENLFIEDKNKEEDGVEEDDNGEFEETLVDPRPLNEVTSVMDRTSPWTTVASDPELSSLESLEAAEQPLGLIHQNEREILMSILVTTSKTQRTATDSELIAWTESCDNAEHDVDVGHAADMHNVCVEPGDDEVFFNKDSKPETSQKTEDHDQHDNTTASEDSDSPLSSSSEADTKTNSERENVESNVKPCNAVDIPNFFLSSRHLEASMRALRLAPFFPSTAQPSASGKSEFTNDRVTQPRSSVPPSSAKREEIKRIAKIFGSHFS